MRTRVMLLGLTWTALALSEVSAAGLFVRATPCSPVDCPASFPSPWSSAGQDLQAALTMANPGDTIYVSVGTYHPDTNGQTSFVLPSGVALKGGYAGVPVLPDPVDPVTYPGDPIGQVIGRSKLSGDIGLRGDLSDNSPAVVVVQGTQTVPGTMEGFDIENDCFSGFTCQAVRIQGGAATISTGTVSGKATAGGAIAITGSAGPVNLSNLTITGEAIVFGGGIYIAGATGTITVSNGTVVGQAQRGGAIYVGGAAGDVLLNGAHVSGQAFQGDGGGILFNSYGRKLTISGGRIHDSTAAGTGGGIQFNGSEVLLTGGVRIENNFADDAAGGSLDTLGGILTVNGAHIVNNEAFGFSNSAPVGGLRLSGGTQKVILAVFQNNRTYGSDPVLPPVSALDLKYGSQPEVASCLFSGSPLATYPYPVLLQFDGGGPALVVNSTFSGPGCGYSGLGYYGEAGIHWTGASLKVANTVLTEHYPFDFAPAFPTTFVASQIYGPFTSPPFDPGTCYPAMGSPLVDAGDNSEVPPYLTASLNGPRFSSKNQCPPIVDVGAYERADPSTLCLADFNGDCAVTVADLLAYLSDWFAANPVADLDGSGTIDTTDLSGIFLSAWFAGCP